LFRNVKEEGKEYSFQLKEVEEGHLRRFNYFFLCQREEQSLAFLGEMDQSVSMLTQLECPQRMIFHHGMLLLVLIH